MRKKIFILIFTTLILISIFVFSGCEKNNDDDISNLPIKQIASIALDDSSIIDKGYVGEYQIDDIRIVVTYNDAKTQIIYATYDMLTEQSKVSLNTVGTHIISLVYNEMTLKFSVSLYEREIVYYDLEIYGGLPTAVNGKKLVGVTETDKGYFLGEYKQGDVITVEWTNNGYLFDYWTANGIKISGQSIIEITMNADYTYRSFTKASVNTVSFVTYCDDVIVSKTTDIINEIDINEISKEGYVFLGWTLDKITEEQSLSAYKRNMVSFPYAVSREAVFYAVWTPVGLIYEETQDGMVVVGFNGELSNLTIPNSYDGKSIVGIKKSAFSSNFGKELKSIHIPETVTFIESGAFANCEYLETLTVSEKSDNYKAVDGVLYDYELKRIVAYPSAKIVAVFECFENIEKIDAYAFYNAIIGGIKLNSKIINIGENAFNTIHLDYVDFSQVNPIGLTVEDEIFNKNIANILLLEATKNSYIEQFVQFELLESKIILDDNDLPQIEIVNRFETDGNKSTLLFRIISNPNFDYTNLSAELIGISRNVVSSTIPVNTNEGYIITSIGEGAYNNCYLLEEVIFPISSKLERICDNAFTDTPWIKSLSNSSITANNVLYKYLGSNSIYSLDIRTKKIAEGAFSNNANLKFVDIGENTALTSIMAYAFFNCTKFEGFICPANSTGEGIYLKSGVKQIGEYAFYNTKISSVKLQTQNMISYNELNKIGEYAFANCKYLKSVEIGEKTLDIANNAFIGDNSLEKFVLLVNNEKFIVFDGILYEKLNYEQYKLFNYPSGKIYGEYSPSIIKNISQDVAINEKVFLENELYSVGEIVFNGETKNVYMGITVDKLNVEIKENDNTLSYKNSNTYLIDTTEITYDEFGTAIPNGEKYFYIQNSDGTLTYLLYDGNGGYTYTQEINVTSIGKYSLHNSNIAGLYVPNSVSFIEENATQLPGLRYVEFEGEPISTYLSMFGTYEPNYVIINHGSASNYFSNNANKMGEKLFAENAIKEEYFFNYDVNTQTENKTILYSLSEGVVSIVRTSRTEDVIVIPEILTHKNGTTYKEGKYIEEYAFFGDYLQEVTLKNIAGLASFAFSEASNFVRLIMETSFISEVEIDTFNSKLNNGLYIFDMKNDINLYMNTQNWGLEYFTYYTIDGEQVYACRYLIQSEEGAFAVIVYNDGQNSITMGIEYEKILSSQIQNMQNNVSKVGHDIDGFIDEEGNNISADSDYIIPYNQVLTCDWIPQEYKIYLAVSNSVSLDLEIYDINNDNETTTYMLNVTYGQDYDFNVLDVDDELLHWRDFNGELFVRSQGIWSYEIDNEITLQLVYAIKLSLTLLNENASVDDDVSYVYYGENYDLPVPISSDGRVFEGWCMLLDGTQVVLSNELGEGVDIWNYNQSNTYEIYAIWSE